MRADGRSGAREGGCGCGDVGRLGVLSTAAEFGAASLLPLPIRYTYTYASIATANCNSGHGQVARVDDVISELGLEEAQHTKIGTPFIKGVSGGQKRRVSIGASPAAHI